MTGFIGSGLILLGMWFIGQKNRLGFMLGLLGEGFWFVRGYTTGLADLMVLAFIFASMHVWNWVQWGERPRLCRRTAEE